MGLFSRSNKAIDGIRLLKRWSFDRNKGRDGDQWVFSTWDSITVTDLYEVDGQTYVVHTYMHDNYHFDIGDDHGSSSEYIQFKVFPISEADAASEEHVRELIAAYKAATYRIDALPENDIRNSKKRFTDFIRPHIRPAINAIRLASKIEKVRAEGNIPPNAVHVNIFGDAFDSRIYDFDSKYGLGEPLDATHITIRRAKGVEELCPSITRPLCWYQRAEARSGTIHNYAMSALMEESLDGDLMICGYNHDEKKPAPLTEAEINAIVEAITQYAKIFNS